MIEAVHSKSNSECRTPSSKPNRTEFLLIKTLPWKNCSVVSFIIHSVLHYVEIKCQLDATDEFLLQILLLAQHVSGTIMPIIRGSRVLYKWLLSVVFGAWFSSCRYSVELRVVCPVCGLQQAIRSAIKTHLLHLVGILFPHIFFCQFIRKFNI
jgi:hypothetical protein